HRPDRPLLQRLRRDGLARRAGTAPAHAPAPDAGRGRAGTGARGVAAPARPPAPARRPGPPARVSALTRLASFGAAGLCAAGGTDLDSHRRHGDRRLSAPSPRTAPRLSPPAAGDERLLELMQIA